MSRVDGKESARPIAAFSVSRNSVWIYPGEELRSDSRAKPGLLVFV
jgi:hypothetical protein